MLYVAKMNENEIKGEVESKLFLYKLILEDTTNFFKQLSDDEEFSGLNLIIGSYSIHLLEGESAIIGKILAKLNQVLIQHQQSNGLYQ